MCFTFFLIYSSDATVCKKQEFGVYLLEREYGGRDVLFHECVSRGEKQGMSHAVNHNTILSQELRFAVSTCQRNRARHLVQKHNRVAE